MPFGPNCEFQSFDECVKAHKDKDDPEAYCAELERRTKEHCDLQAFLEQRNTMMRRLLKTFGLQ